MIATRAATDCKYDILALGEIMLRLDPGEGRIHTSRQFSAWEGGGEYNVARALKRCFGFRAAVVTALARNPIGLLLEDLIYQGGVNMEYIKWFDYDGIGRNVRNGLNFTERGHGVRAAVGCSDRGHTAVSHLKPGDIDWDHIFGSDGVCWLHTGGIFAGLSESTAQVTLEAVKAAKRCGTVVSYDMNYRPSLWAGIGGEAKAREVNEAIAPFVDVMIGNEEHFRICLGLDMAEPQDRFDPGHFKSLVHKALTRFPNFAAVATTLRNDKTASRTDWTAMLYQDGNFHRARLLQDLDVLDRVGGGDSFASGLIYGLLAGKPPQACVDLGVAHGALAMTTPGDTSSASLAEVERVAAGGDARAQR